MSGDANDPDLLRAEIARLRSRLEAAERALAEERVTRLHSAERSPAAFELSPQAIEDIARAVAAAQRRRSPWRRAWRRLLGER
jgi:hypothetical protein